MLVKIKSVNPDYSQPTAIESNFAILSVDFLAESAVCGTRHAAGHVNIVAGALIIPNIVIYRKIVHSYAFHMIQKFLDFWVSDSVKV